MGGKTRKEGKGEEVKGERKRRRFPEYFKRMYTKRANTVRRRGMENCDKYTSKASKNNHFHFNHNLRNSS